MDLDNLYSINHDTVEIQLADTDMYVTVRPADTTFNPEFRKAAARILKSGADLDATSENFEESREKYAKCFAKSIIVGWRNVKSGGKEVKFSEENAYKMLVKYPKFLDYIAVESVDLSNFRSEKEQNAKN